MVTGAARGIGAEVARTLGRVGASLMLCDVIDGADILGELAAAGINARFRSLDVRRADDWAAAMAEVDEMFGRLDILVNNAGVFIVRPIEQSTEEDYQFQMDVNLKGVFLGTKAALPLMKRITREQDSGSIVNLSSVAALVGSANAALYGASKGAVRAFTKAAAIELPGAGYNIRCNSVHPGMVDTAMAVTALDRFSGTDAEKRATVAARYPLGRVAQPADIAAAVLYLASPAAGFVTGTELVVDGGMSAQ